MSTEGICLKLLMNQISSFSRIERFIKALKQDVNPPIRGQKCSKAWPKPSSHCVFSVKAPSSQIRSRSSHQTRLSAFTFARRSNEHEVFRRVRGVRDLLVAGMIDLLVFESESRLLTHVMLMLREESWTGRSSMGFSEQLCLLRQLVKETFINAALTSMTRPNSIPSK